MDVVQTALMDGDRPQEQDGGGAEAYARGGAATLLTIKGKEKDRSREIGTKGEVVVATQLYTDKRENVGGSQSIVKLHANHINFFGSFVLHLNPCSLSSENVLPNVWLNVL